MSAINLNSALAPPPTVDARDQGFAGLTSSDFLELLVTEMQNQDPLEPMTNDQILTQLSSMRELEANQSLTQSIENLATGQNVTSAAALVGREITGLDASGSPVSGIVDSATVTDGSATLVVGGDSLPLGNVQTVR